MQRSSGSSEAGCGGCRGETGSSLTPQGVEVVWTRRRERGPPQAVGQRELSGNLSGGVRQAGLWKGLSFAVLGLLEAALGCGSLGRRLCCPPPLNRPMALKLGGRPRELRGRDTHEESPLFQTLPVGSVVFTVLAEDKDSGSAGAVRYFIEKVCVTDPGAPGGSRPHCLTSTRGQHPLRQPSPDPPAFLQ